MTTLDPYNFKFGFWKVSISDALEYYYYFNELLLLRKMLWYKKLDNDNHTYHYMSLLIGKKSWKKKVPVN